MAGSHSRRAVGTLKRRWLRGVGASLLVLAMAPWLGLAAANAADSVTVELKAEQRVTPTPAPYAGFVNTGECLDYTGTGTLFHFVFNGSNAAAGSDTPNITAIVVTFDPTTTYTTNIIQNGQQVDVVAVGQPTLVTAVATLDRAYDRGELVLSHVCLGKGISTTDATPVSPTFMDSVCTGTGSAVTQASYTIEATDGVEYRVDEMIKPVGSYEVGNGTSVTVTAVAKPGFTLTGPASFTHTFANPVCSTPVTVTPIPATAVTPMVTDAKCTDNGQSATVATYTIPATTGVDYAVNGVVKPAGTYTVGNGIGSVTVTAAAQMGYVLTGTTTFPLTFKPAKCEVPVAPAVAPTPVAPVVAPIAPVAPVVAPVAPVVGLAPVVAPIVEGVKITSTTPVTAPTTASGSETTPTQSATVEGVKVEATTSAALGALPRTGSEVMPLIAISGLLLLAGMTIMRLSGGRYQRTGRH